MRTRRGHRQAALRALALALLFGACSARGQDDQPVDYSPAATVFVRHELRLAANGPLRDLSRIPDAQVHDAYDADRNGVFVRIDAEFRHAGGDVLTVSGFAMKEKTGEPWVWRIRWAPPRAGTWTVRIVATCGLGEKSGVRVSELRPKQVITATASDGIDGPLAAPDKAQAPGFLRRLNADGSSEPLWLFGACRAWVAHLQDKNNDWSPHEWMDRETELLAPMRVGGFNLLNQWMAPWEFLLVHHDRAEFWKQADGRWTREPLPKDAAWTSYQHLDQGRARAFDDLVTQCEGGPGKPTIYLLLSPLPHQCLQVKEHPWGGQESGWSPENDAGKQTPERLNGFSGFRPNMSVWDFFEADPARPAGDWRSQLFDHQANFYRYAIARWSYSRAVGVWVIVDELDAVGDVVGVMSAKKGWWGHPQCGRWLADVIRLFRGTLVRADGLRYPGDPFRHPRHVATTSFGGQAGRGGNIDWDGGPADARPDLFGWHWYPAWANGATWNDVWAYAIDGVASYSDAPIGPVPRLISEFGAPDRDVPDEAPSNLYPTLYHHAIWAAIFSGQAGTPMDWDDGKQFGELRWRERKGAFDREHYPINHVEQLQALRAFLAGLVPDKLAPCKAAGARIRCAAGGSLRVLALYSVERPDSVYGWLFSADGSAKLKISGLAEGNYRLAWHDPWTGKATGQAQSVNVEEGGVLALDAGPVLAALRAAAKPFPGQSRMAKGSDVAFKLIRAGNDEKE